MEQTELKNLKSADFDKMKEEDLKDITKFNITQNEPPIQRLIRFMYSMKNPYIFRVGKTPVKVVFSKQLNAVSLQKGLENIARNK